MSALTVFGIAIGWLAYVYVGYPIAIAILGRLGPFRHQTSSEYLPSVSVLISARNEEKDIRWKVEETLAWDYPSDRLELLVASDASSDSTDGILQTITDPRLRWLRIEHRAGKNEALNRLARLATGDLLLFTDANSHIGPRGLRRIVRHFADPRVGCVTGTEETITEKQSLLSAGSTAYLSYEERIQCAESRLGSVLVCDGSIFCLLRELYRPVQLDLANDLELPLRIGKEGWAILFEQEARSFERATRSLKQEFDRRRRICAQGALGAWRLRRCLGGLRGWQFLSRKVLRWLGAIPLAFLLLSSALLARHALFATFFGVQLFFYGLAAAGWWRVRRGRQTPQALSLPLFFTLGHAAALTGVVESCLGRRFRTWEIPTLSRGREEAI
jgi:biofilm PGA synthesis N-glycosyltransferase PgaC